MGIFSQNIVYMGKINKLAIISLPLSLVLSLFSMNSVSATCSQGQQSCSSDYGVGQYFFGSGGSLDTTCSTSYCAAQTLGETGVGLIKSTTYQAYPGFEVNREPSLQITVNTAAVNMGVLSPSSTATGTATFSVESYLASGYDVISASPAPTSEGHTLASSSTPSLSTPGTEQFGINLVSNTTACGAPASFGANPVQVPSSAYSYGQAASGYNTCGYFAYANGAVIADSTQSSGQTNYKISYIENISNVTPAGYYVMNQSLIAVSTF